MPQKLLFASIHSYLDPSSGAALATRELLELLAHAGGIAEHFLAVCSTFKKTLPLKTCSRQ